MLRLRTLSYWLLWSMYANKDPERSVLKVLFQRTVRKEPGLASVAEADRSS